jgi:mannosyltransferase OCH1-like enzyme
MSVTIPKIIMQTWKTHSVPEKWKRSPESIRRWMGDWKYVLMNDKDNRAFVAKHFPDFLPYYDRFEYPIQRADAIRYCWLSIHGGIYMDLDMELQKPLDDLFTSHYGPYLVGSSNVGSYITNSFMASTPGHPFWLEVIEEMKKPLPWWCIGRHFKVMNSTGPMMLDRVAKRGSHVYATLPSRSLRQCSVCELTCSQPNAYIKPLEGSSWISYDTKIYLFLFCNWKTILLVIIIALIVWLIWRRLT